MFRSNFLSCGCKNIRCFKMFSTQYETNSQIISDIFGLPVREAKNYVEKHRLQNKDSEILIENVNVCKKLGYTKDEIFHTPHLLSRNPLEVEQHYYSLKEGGFHYIKPQTLARARSHMKKVVSYLKSANLIKPFVNVPKEFIAHIEDKDIAQQIPQNYDDKEKWRDIHLEILKDYLRIRLSATEDEILNLIEVHPIIKTKSFKIIQKNIKLAEDLGFEPRKIIKYGYLLGVYPAYPEATLQDLSDLAGMNMRQAMRAYPKLVMISPKRILKIYGILKEFDIPDELIRNQPNVFILSPETVRVRLQEISQSNDLKVLLSHPRVLALIINHNRAKMRYSFLQQLQLRCTSFSILRTHFHEVFEEYVKEGKDVNKVSDLVPFLQKLFTVSLKDIRERIRRHPYYLQVPLKDIQETFDYLVQNKFSTGDIYKAIFIILYPKSKVHNAHITIKHDSNYKYNQLSPVNKLNLMLYMIEKEHHFTGNGIWRNYKVLESEEKVS